MVQLTPAAAKKIQYVYVAGQMLSVGATFASPWIAINDLKNSNQRGLESVFFYSSILLSTILTGVVGGFTAAKFQGAKIGVGHDHSGERLAYELAPRNWKSNVAETAYLAFSISLMVFYNYFLMTAMEVLYKTFKDPDNTSPIETLNGVWFVAFLIKCFVIDIFFDMTNIDYEPAEEIKKKFTGSKTGPLASLLIKPLSKPLLLKPVITWINTAGVISHTLTDYCGTLLSLPPMVYVHLYQSPELFWPLFSVIALISLPLLFVNYVQTLYFEAKESEMNLKNINPEKDFTEIYPLLAEKEDKRTFLHLLLDKAPWLTKPIRYGFYSHPVMHAGSDTLPVVLLLRDMFSRLGISAGIQAAIIIPAALFVFGSSAIGTLHSEVTEAMEHYKEEFEDGDEHSHSHSHGMH